MPLTTCNLILERQTVFFQLVKAVLLNRIMALKFDNILINEQTWYPLFHEMNKLGLVQHSVSDGTDSMNIEQFKYKLFEAILYPFYGYCDSKTKVEKFPKLFVVNVKKFKN